MAPPMGGANVAVLRGGSGAAVEFEGGGPVDRILPEDLWDELKVVGEACSY